MHTVEKKSHNSGYPIPVQETQEIAERERERPVLQISRAGGHAPGPP